MSDLSVGAHVLVCGDIFDADNSHWQQSMGLGEYTNTDPPEKTVFLVAKVEKLLPEDEIRLKFLIDHGKITVRVDEIDSTMAPDHALPPPIWVFREGKGQRLFRLEGVVFKKGGLQEVAKPQIFASADLPSSELPKRKEVAKKKSVIATASILDEYHDDIDDINETEDKIASAVINR